MNKTVFVAFLMLVSLSLSSQVAPNKYWIQFADKKNNPYSIHKPGLYLSERALQRRINQHLSIDEYDLPVTPDYISAVKSTGAKLLVVSKWLNGVVVECADNTVLDKIEALSFVSQTHRCHDRPDKSFYDEQSTEEVERSLMPSFYGEAFQHIGQINGKPLHDAGFMGQDMVIAVIDGGFSGADTIKVLRQLRDDGRLLGTRNFVNNETSVFASSQHGTSCLGLMAGYIPNEYVGTAPMASYYLFVSEDVASENLIEEYNWVAAAELADSLGVDVCSTSLGYYEFDMSELTHDSSDLDGATTPISRGAVVACSRGMMCVTSAGNSRQTNFPYVNAPGDVEPVLTIGAVNNNGNMANFSSIGPTADNRVKPDVVAMGVGCSVAACNGTFFNGSGTSYSCPIIAGMVTCLWQSRCYATPTALAEAVRQTASMAATPDYEYGYGIPDFEAAMNSLPLIEAPQSDTLISIMPNPSNGNFHINLNNVFKVNINVTDIIGRRLLTCRINAFDTVELECAMNSLPTGVYFVTAYTEEHYQTVKVVVL